MNLVNRDELNKLLSEARIRPRIKRDLRFVPEEIADWEERDFLAATNRSRSEGVIIAPLDQLYVVPFHLQRRSANKTGRVEAIICDFCATWQRGSNSALISFQKDKSIVTFLCCADLNCSLHVRDKTSEAKLSRVQLRETTDIQERVERLQHRLQAVLQEIE